MALFKSRSSAYLAGGAALTVAFLLITIASYNSTPRSLISHATQSLRSDLLDHIQNATLGFQKIYVINLPSRTDHRDAMALAASVTGLEVEFVDGVTEVATKALPPGGSETKLSEGELGNWRAHMNIAQRMTEQGIASALILEDDVDWDLRLKRQMQDFAKASQLLVQPLPGTTDQFIDPTYPIPSPEDTPTNFYIDKPPAITKPTTSPYGDLDRWDLLWVGHCGNYFPFTNKSSNRPLGRAVILDDETVPEPQHIAIQFGNKELTEEYPPHTRVVTRANRNICTFGYALSLPGARRLLYELGVRNNDSPTDIAFRTYCDGDKRPVRTCVTVQPELIQHHRPIGLKSALSDIGFHGDDYNEEAFTRNIRWSTRLNMAKLLEGQTDYTDLYKDGEPAKDWGWGKRR